MARSIPIDPGERDRAVKIEQRSATDAVGDSGDPVETWTTLATPVWMRRIDVTGSERFQASQISAPYSTRWQMSYRPDMDPEVYDVTKVRRLIYKAQVYDIVHGARTEDRGGIELSCQASGRAS